jgi:hypothetical protein
MSASEFPRLSLALLASAIALFLFGATVIRDSGDEAGSTRTRADPTSLRSPPLSVQPQPVTTVLASGAPSHSVPVRASGAPSHSVPVFTTPPSLLASSDLTVLPGGSAPIGSSTNGNVTDASSKYSPRSDCNRSGCHGVQFPGPVPPRRTLPEHTVLLPQVCIDRVGKKVGEQLHRVGGAPAATMAECRLLCINTPTCIAWSHGTPRTTAIAATATTVPAKCGLFGQLLYVSLWHCPARPCHSPRTERSHLTAAVCP